jgi:hypothetical protein
MTQQEKIETAASKLREAQQNYLNALVEVLKSQLELKKITIKQFKEDKQYAYKG